MALDFESVSDRARFVEFVRDLCDSLERGDSFWENTTLESFLDTLAFWVEDRMPDMWERHGNKMPDSACWQSFAELLYVAAVYE